jgi:predicted glycosyltransferase
MPASLLYYVSGHGYGHARRSAEVVRALRSIAPDVNVYVRTSAPAEPFQGLRLGSSLDFSDLLVVSDVVVSKLGCGTIAECIAAGTRLVWPPRRGSGRTR